MICLFSPYKELYYFSFIPMMRRRGCKAGVPLCVYFSLGMDWGDNALAFDGKGENMIIGAYFRKACFVVFLLY